MTVEKKAVFVYCSTQYKCISFFIKINKNIGGFLLIRFSIIHQGYNNKIVHTDKTVDDDYNIKEFCDTSKLFYPKMFKAIKVINLDTSEVYLEVGNFTE